MHTLYTRGPVYIPILHGITLESAAHLFYTMAQKDVANIITVTYTQHSMTKSGVL